MKSAEFHRLIRRNGWILVSSRGKGSHLGYEKDGIIVFVPFHGSKEMSEALRKSFVKNMNLR